MTKARVAKELAKAYAQLEQLKERIKYLEEEKQMAEDAEAMKMIKKYKISSERLQLLNGLNEEEIARFLEKKEKESRENGAGEITV